MNKSKNTSAARKIAAAAAALALCLTLSVTALAEAGVLKGYFADVTNFTGAVVGTTYENADDEINVSVNADGGVLTVTAAFVDRANPPFFAEALGIARYSVADADGNVIKEGAAEASAIVDGQAEITIDLTDIADGNYTLTVTSFVAESKADQPMPVNGVWVCHFAK